jgi:hypothetical protein
MAYCVGRLRYEANRARWCGGSRTPVNIVPSLNKERGGVRCHLPSPCGTGSRQRHPISKSFSLPEGSATLYTSSGSGIGLCGSHQFLYKPKDRNHNRQISKGNRRECKCGDPPRCPRDKQDERDMESYDGEHRNPKPHRPPQFPSECDGKDNHHNGQQRWSCEIISSTNAEQESDKRAADDDAHQGPPRQNYRCLLLHVILYQ